MSDYLFDTNVLSELARPLPNPGVFRWASQVSPINLSAVTVDEIYFGLTRRPNTRILTWFETLLTTKCRVLPVTVEIAKLAGQLRGQLSVKGQVRTQADMLIAATALVYGFTLVTRNERDFQDCGLILLNPFV